MRYKFIFILLFSFSLSNSQTINLNESHLIDYLRTSQLSGDLNSNFSFTQRPIHLGKNGLNINDSIFNLNKYSPTVLNFMKGKGLIKVLPIDYNIEFSSKHPYNRNNLNIFFLKIKVLMVSMTDMKMLFGPEGIIYGTMQIFQKDSGRKVITKP